MADDNTEAVKQPENNKLTGFQLHPECINKNGRPKKEQSLTEIMRQLFHENEQIPKAIVAKLLQMAANGDIAAIREVLDRIEGKPLQKTEIGGMDGQEFRFAVLAGLGFVPPATAIDATSEGGTVAEQPQIQGTSVAQESPQNNNGTV